MSGQNSPKTRDEKTEKLTDRVVGRCLRVQLGSQQDTIDDKGRGRQKMKKKKKEHNKKEKKAQFLLCTFGRIPVPFKKTGIGILSPNSHYHNTFNHFRCFPTIIHKNGNT